MALASWGSIRYWAVGLFYGSRLNDGYLTAHLGVNVLAGRARATRRPRAARSRRPFCVHHHKSATPPLDPMLKEALMLALVAPASAWVTISQSRFGAQIETIRDLMRTHVPVFTSDCLNASVLSLGRVSPSQIFL